MIERAHKIFDLILEKKYVFATIFFSVSFSTFAFLYATGLIPEEFKATRSEAQAQEDSPEEADAVQRDAETTKNRTDAELSEDAKRELPTRIVIDKIGVNSIIVNPESTSLKVLDEELKRGVVRYPTSGKLGEGNMFLFGHSTSIRVVNNQAYKALNGLGKLNVGDEIIVESGTKAYVYKVFSVRLTESDEALVQLENAKNMLTLSTCNTFGGKEERFVVEADFVEMRSVR